jgi:hypothetical protein
VEGLAAGVEATLAWGRGFIVRRLLTLARHTGVIRRGAAGSGSRGGGGCGSGLSGRLDGGGGAAWPPGDGGAGGSGGSGAPALGSALRWSG